MKKSILVVALGLILNITRLTGAECFHDIVAKHHHFHSDSKEQDCLIGTLSASSTTLQILSDSSTPLSFDTYEFNTDPRAILFSPSTPTQFTLKGPGVFLIEVSGILDTNTTISPSDNVQISLYNLTSAVDVLPSPLYTWEPGFSAPSGTQVGFGISRAIQLSHDQKITYEITTLASTPSAFTVNNKIISVTQLQ